MSEYTISELEPTERGILALDFEFKQEDIDKATHYVQEMANDYGIKVIGTLTECQAYVASVGGRLQEFVPTMTEDAERWDGLS